MIQTLVKPVRSQLQISNCRDVSIPVAQADIPSHHDNLLRGLIKSNFIKHGLDIDYKISGVVGLLNKHDQSINPGRLRTMDKSRIVIRLASEYAVQVAELFSDRRLGLGIDSITTGAAEIYSLNPCSKLYSYCFFTKRITDSVEMHRYLTNKLCQMGVEARVDIIQPRVVVINQGKILRGFSVLLSGLTDEDSLYIQSIVDNSFGGKGHYGCSFWKHGK